jgi:hypothetical protein
VTLPKEENPSGLLRCASPQDGCEFQEPNAGGRELDSNREGYRIDATGSDTISPSSPARDLGAVLIAI